MMRTIPRGLLVALITLGVTAAFLLSLAVLIALAAHVVLPLVPSAGGGSRLTIVLSLYVTVSAYVALNAFTAVWVNDRLERRPSSALLMPIIVTAAGITGVLAIVSAGQIDRLLHGPYPRWTWLADPDVRLLSLALFTLVAVGLWLKVRPLLTGYGMGERAAAALIVGANVAIVALVTVAVIVV